jgi:hypothetical protein
MKKRLIVLNVTIIVFTGLIGCQLNSNKAASCSGPANIQQRISFPKFLVGTWKTENSRWVFTFERDGRISKMTHFGGMEFDVNEGGLVEQWREDIEAAYMLGPCEALYNPDTRQLSVTINVEYWIITFPDGSLEGSFHDYLNGPVSKDGKTWNASWTSIGEIIGADAPDPNAVKPKALIFTKIE